MIGPSREFTVGAVARNVAGGGHLLIGPGRLELRTGVLTGRLPKIDVVQHRGSMVTAYTARLLPPWMNCSIVVSDGERSVLATFPIWMRRKVFSSLRDSGFEVRHKVTRIERGYESMTF